VTGAAATPKNVLASIADAGEIVIDVHGIVDQGGPEASYLALSPDRDGRYALTPNLVRATTLRGNPTVVLAACHGSKNQAVMHEPWSLPAAFVYAGARAVIASPEPMPDRDATAFFTEMHAKLVAGAPAAVALRDTRSAWLAANNGAWVEDLLVFE
jgi:CHAT domain-containing protein